MAAGARLKGGTLKWETYATNEFEEWSDEVSDRADNVFKKDKKEGPVKDREKRIKEMDEVIKKDLE